MCKKQFIILITLIFVFCSCNKQEIFSPSQYIETESLSKTKGGMEVVKRFAYLDKQLTSVWLVGDVTLTFEYNSDKTVSRINSSEKNNTYAQLSYENKKITQIQYYEENELAREIVFGRKDGGTTINKVEKYVYDGFLAKSALADMLFPETKSLPQSMLKSHKSSAGKSLYSIENVTYEGDNISRVRWYSVKDGEQTLQTVTSYKYDDKKNPYYGLPYAFLELSGYNKNNITSIVISYESGQDKKDQKILTIENVYFYNKNYPVNNSVTEHTTYIVAYDKDKNPIFQTDTKSYTVQYGYK